MSLYEQKLAERASLVADICEMLRNGSNPLPRVKGEYWLRMDLGHQGLDREEQGFFSGLFGALQMTRA